VLSLTQLRNNAVGYLEIYLKWLFFPTLLKVVVVNFYTD